MYIAPLTGTLAMGVEESDDVTEHVFRAEQPRPDQPGAFLRAEQTGGHRQWHYVLVQFRPEVLCDKTKSYKKIFFCRSYSFVQSASAANINVTNADAGVSGFYRLILSSASDQLDCRGSRLL